jgi:hypothetical protein
MAKLFPAMLAVQGLLLASGYSAQAAAPPAPAGLELARGLDSTEIGVDREGNLWTWDAHGQRVGLYSPQGERLCSVPIEFSNAVDADRTWGIAGIFGFGKELRLLSWEGKAAATIPLADEARAVAWIGPDTVAVAPALAAHRVEIWNVRDRTLTRKIGSEQPLTPRPGATRLRTVALHYQPERGLLYTLESFTGDLEVYALDGRLVREAKVPPVKRSIDESLAEMDRKARARNDVQTPAFWWYRLAVDGAGTVWTVQSCDAERLDTTLFKVPLEGEARTLVLTNFCCALKLAVWGGWAISYPDPGLTKPTCDKVRRLP